MLVAQWSIARAQRVRVIAFRENGYAQSRNNLTGKVRPSAGELEKPFTFTSACCILIEFFGFCNSLVDIRVSASTGVCGSEQE